VANISNRAEIKMVSGSGEFGLLYGPTIREKIKTADRSTLLAYRTVAHDLLKGAAAPDADGLRASLTDLETAIKAKS
jgi:hypothetical protein